MVPARACATTAVPVESQSKQGWCGACAENWPPLQWFGSKQDTIIVRWLPSNIKIRDMNIEQPSISVQDQVKTITICARKFHGHGINVWKSRNVRLFLHDHKKKLNKPFSCWCRLEIETPDLILRNLKWRRLTVLDSSSLSMESSSLSMDF